MNWPIMLVVYHIKHFICDYLLQGKMMLGKFKPYPDYIMPLFCHCLVHFLGTFIIACFVDPDHATWYAIFDGAVHFIVDRIKASPDLLGRFEALSKREMVQVMEDMEYFKQFPGTTTTMNCQPQTEKKLKSNTYFWWCLGLDQEMHHLTHIAIIYMMIGRG